MESRRGQQIDRFFHAALARPADERAAFLEEACAGDEAVRHEVEAFLDSTPTVEPVTANTRPRISAVVRPGRVPEHSKEPLRVGA